MHRVYTSTAHFRAPFDTPNISFAGLGQARSWPAGRTYYDVANYRSPYDNGYYQSGALRGLTGVALNWKPLAAGVGVAAVAGLVLGDPGDRFQSAKLGLALGGVAAVVALWMAE